MRVPKALQPYMGGLEVILPEACKCGSDPARLRSFPPEAERPSDALREAG